MDEAQTQHGPISPERVLPIVVGAQLAAEVEDRPIAAALGTALVRAAPERFPLTVVVVTDLWYLNSEPLRSQPTISVGRPDANALSAYLADKLPSALSVDGRWMVQLDPEMVEPVVCCWGSDAAGTAEAARMFMARWGYEFLRAAVASVRTTFDDRNLPR
jgi:hypothetical protein